MRGMQLHLSDTQNLDPPFNPLEGDEGETLNSKTQYLRIPNYQHQIHISWWPPKRHHSGQANVNPYGRMRFNF